MARNFWAPEKGLHGLFDVKSFRKLDAVVASGLGGGSLLYANVLVRKDEDWFVQGEPLPDGGHETWPLNRADLDPHYDAVEEMLTPSAVPLGMPGFGPLHKTTAMRIAADRIGAEFDLPGLGVTFAPSEGAAPVAGHPIAPAPYGNLHGALRRTCRMCGECNLGCNEGAKNSMDHTYLSAAYRQGADLRTSCEVTSILPRSGGGYLVGYLDHSTGQGVQLTCQRLVLAAGALGTMALLLRNRRGFPGMSPALGHRFSGNGDLLGFLLNSSRPIHPSKGPVISCTVRFPDGRGCYVQDAGYPSFIDWLVELSQVRSLGGRAARYFARRMGASGISWRHGAELAELLGQGALSGTSMPLLAMGRERPAGRLMLRKGKLELDWDMQRSRDYFDQARTNMRQLAEAIGATYRDNPMWRFDRLITVHPMGGAVMARHPAEGVCDAYGEVFGFPGLHIVDASVMPGSVGPNPALTIAAFANRAAERILDDRGSARIHHIRRVEQPAPAALRFRESMIGTFAGTKLVLNLTVDIRDIDRFVSTATHEATLSGLIDCTALGGRLRITESTARILVRTDTPHQRRMLYRLSAIVPTGQTVTLIGTKEVGARTPMGLLRDTTTMRVRIHRVGSVTPERAIVSLPLRELIRMLGTFRASGPRPIRTVVSFLRFFIGELLSVVARRDTPAVTTKPAAAHRKAS